MKRRDAIKTVIGSIAAASTGAVASEAVTGKYSAVMAAFPEGCWVFGLGEHKGCSQTFDYEHPNRPQPFSYLDATNPSDFRMATGEEIVEAMGAPIDDMQHWKETARQFHQNEIFYRGIVHQVGELLGRDCYVSDDGSVQDEVLALKVVDVLRDRLAKQNDNAYAAIGWTHADACVDLDQGRDPREKEVGGMLIRAGKDLGLVDI